jgi:hypothetical protein
MKSATATTPSRQERTQPESVEDPGGFKLELVNP